MGPLPHLRSGGHPALPPLISAQLERLRALPFSEQVGNQQLLSLEPWQEPTRKPPEQNCPLWNLASSRFRPHVAATTCCHVSLSFMLPIRIMCCQSAHRMLPRASVAKMTRQQQNLILSKIICLCCIMDTSRHVLSNLILLRETHKQNNNIRQILFAFVVMMCENIIVETKSTQRNTQNEGYEK